MSEQRRYAWQKLGQRWHLTGQFGMRPIELATFYDRKRNLHHLAFRDDEHDLLVPATPEHPTAALIEDAFNNQALNVAAPDLLAACLAVAAEHDKYSDVGLATIGKVQAAIAKAIQKAEPNA